MFTGLIEEVGTIQHVALTGAGQKELTVGCDLILSDIKLGDSVAVNGVCLTVLRYGDHSVSFAVSGETLQKSLLGHMSVGAKVNLERALKIGDRLGGHFVQGHVDSLARLIKIDSLGGFYNLWFQFPDTVARYLIPKGSVAIDGISLTVAELEATQFMVAIIPHSYHKTRLETLKIQDQVHLETDLLGRYVERMLQVSPVEKEVVSKIDEGFLKENGFF